MSKFNQKSPGTPTVKNYAGGQAYQQSPELELVSMLLTSFVNDTHYRSADDTIKRIQEIIPRVDSKFVAQAAIYARKQFGMRSISHIVASELAAPLSSHTWAKDFYEAVIHRPDDMLEIAAYHKANKGKMSNAMKKGFAKAFDRFDGYQLAKYRGEDKGVKLIDIVNMVHPVPIGQNAEAIKQLVAGELKSSETWEAKLSAAGSDTDAKAEAWETLLKENKLGYMALLKNLRNIIAQAPAAIDLACEALVNPVAIKKSLVLPFRFTTAYEELAKLTGTTDVRKIIVALNSALDISVVNVPKFDGETLVVLDVSGSMAGKPAQIGSLFSAVLLKSNNCDFMNFSTAARYENYNPMDSVITIANGLKFASGGTNFPSIFQTANKKYDRVIILSDMQGWIGHYTPKAEFDAYRKRTGAAPFIYSFDLNGLGSMQFPESKVFAIAGFSDKVFDLMQMLETDKQALINTIKRVEF